MKTVRSWTLVSLALVAIVLVVGGDALPQGHSLRVSLSWQNPSTPNLDLIVRDPLGHEVSARTPRVASGGQLDFDDRCAPVAGGGPENVSWPAGGAPEGEYELRISYVDSCGESLPTAWQIVLQIDGEEQVLRGTIQPEETLPVTRFVVGPQDATLNRVVQTFPLPDQEDVPPDTLIVLGFARAMQTESARDNVELATFPQGELVNLSQTWSAEGTTLLLLPEEPLRSGTTYRLSVGTSIVDTAGNRLALGSRLRLNPDDPGRYFLDFTTAPDRTAPRVIGTYPSNGAVDVPLKPAIQLRFSERLHPNSVRSDSVFLVAGERGATPLAAVTIWNETYERVYLVPEGTLKPHQIYRVFVRRSLSDLAGNPLAQGSLLERSALDGEVVYRLRFRTAP